tara:strand:+ start:3546 stop:4142 length:597 start_codon:yes stop_codon:yes gene_type:complete
MNPTFALNIKSLVVKAYATPELARSQGNGAILFTSAEELLADRNITGKILVDAFNEVSPKPVKKFSDNKTAARRYMTAIDDLHVTYASLKKPTPQVAALPGMTPLGITPWNLVKGVAPSKDNATKPTKARGAFAGKTIRVIELDNPRKEGTRAHKTYSLYISGGSYEDLVANAAGWSNKGGVREDVAHDLKKGRIELI